MQTVAAKPQELPVELDPTTTALVITDPAQQLVTEKGVLRPPPSGAPPAATNVALLLDVARYCGVPIVVSRHYYYPLDHGWRLDWALERLMRRIGMFPSRGPWILGDHPNGDGRSATRGRRTGGGGNQLRGRERMGLALELARRGVHRILLAGPAADPCVRGHLAEFHEQGFEVTLVRDATGVIAMEAEDACTTRDVVEALIQGSVH